MTALRRFNSRTFAALAIPNYRRYFAGQAVSLVGTWMQTIAMGWLLLTLTGSGVGVAERACEHADGGPEAGDVLGGHRWSVGAAAHE